MSTTTQILFHSPALHSLKRDQLVKLCKIHSLKGSGKKQELIERLQLHAKTLPPDDPLSIAIQNDNLDMKPAIDSEDEVSSNHSTPVNKPRPGEQWEVVMDTITEVDEETLRSNRGTSDRPVGEFGTNTSKASVTSSLRTIANSLGLKRNGPKSNEPTSSSSLSSKDVIQSSSTLPTSERYGAQEGPQVEPVPGQSNLQGFPAPANARLSLTQAATTTTIRLIPNLSTNPELLLSPPKLKPFATSFDLVPATPGGAGNSTIPVWPLSPGGAARESLYPVVPTFEEFGDGVLQQSPRCGQYDYSDMDIDPDIPGGLTVPSIHEPMPTETRTSARFNTGATPKSTEKPSAEPVDIFSPAPKPQKMSTCSKLGIPRSEPFMFGSPLPQNNTSNLQFRTAAQSVLDEMNKRLAAEGVEAIDANVLDHRRTTEGSTEKQASDVPLRVGDVFDKIHQKEFGKMDSITSHYAAKRGVQSTVSQPILSKKRKSSLVIKDRQMGIPAARHRPNGSRIVSGASVRTPPGAFEEGEDEDDVAERRMSKRPRVEREESDAPAEPEAEKASLPPPPDPEEETRKQKEREAIRRRLEHNKAKRRSSMGRPSLGRAPPPKPTRFGFLASAKSLVQHVWNRGAGSKPPSNIPVTKPAQALKETKSLSKATNMKKAAVVAGSSGVPPVGSQAKRTPSGGSSSSVQTNAAGRSALAPPVVSGEGAGTSSRTWKSFIPSPNPSQAANPRSSSTIAGFGPSNTTLVGFASMGTKASSMGHKSNIRSSTSSKPTGTIPRPRTTSTLMAPTASSLAKMATQRTSHNENGTLGRAGAKSRVAESPPALEQITNSPGSQGSKVLGQPLSPVPAMSLTAAATRIVAAAEKPTPVMRETPKVLAGRRPRISRSKVIARLASQRAAGASSVGSSSRGGKVRSSVGAEVAGKTRQPHGGVKGNDVLMSAKKRVRQSEQARRRSRAVESDRMGVE